MFLAWRTLTTGVPVVLGFGLAVHRYGGAALRREPPAEVPPDAAEIA